MKAILVDDEALALDFLEHQINKVGDIEVIGKFNHLDIEKHVALLEEVDVLFLDIEMPEMNGLELAERILEIDAGISIVFVTAFNHYAVQAFELNALDYVLKPIQTDRLKKTLERVELKVNQRIHKPFKKNNVLRVNVSRALSFKLTNEKLDFIQFRTTKSQELFLYLLHHHGKTIRKTELIELLWTDFYEEKANPQLYTAIYHIRKTLEEYSGYFHIKNVGESYILSTQNVFIDLVEWEKEISSAPPVNTDTIDSYEKTMKLYTGANLQEYDYLWAEGERFRLEKLWIKVAYQMASYYYKQDNWEMSEAWYFKICTVRPEEENAHFLLMKLYAKWGIGLLIDNQYRQLTKAMEDLGLEVSSYITQWYEQWKSNKAI